MLFDIWEFLDEPLPPELFAKPEEATPDELDQVGGGIPFVNM